jgi:hypothetical protein
MGAEILLMKRILISISLLLALFANGQHGNRQTFWSFLHNRVVIPPIGGTTSLSFVELPPATDYSRPGGNERWNEQSGSQIVSGVPTPQVHYRRFSWADLEGNTVAGSWKFTTKLRSKFIDAINAGAMFAFGVMQLYPEACSESFNDSYSYDGSCSVYPEYVHDVMQSSGTGDFSDGTTWIPNYNNSFWLARWDSLLRNTNRYIDTASYTATSGPRNGQLVYFRDVVSYVDVRGLGSYGEGHHCCLGSGYSTIANWPAGRFPTIATMKRIIDIGADAFTNYPNCIIINWLDGGFDNGNGFANTKIPIEVGIYALTKTNTFGKLGLRRDQWGDNESYYHSILENNLMTFGGVRADTAIKNRYKYSFFLGEPPGYNNGGSTLRNGVNMGWVPSQAEILHPFSIGNGNYGGTGNMTGSMPDSMRKAFRMAGSRTKIVSGNMTTTLQPNVSFNITLNFQNIGLAVEHWRWNTTYELRNSSNVTVWTGTSNFTLKGFAPISTTTSVSNSYILPGSVSPGTYRLMIKIIDPTGYRSPYPLGINGRESDGAYPVRTGIFVIPQT